MVNKTKQLNMIDEYTIAKNVKEAKYSKEDRDLLLKFARRFNELLGENISQSNFSKQTGISTGAISKYRNGFVFPPANNLYKIAKALNVSTEYLLGNSDVKHYNNKELNDKFGLYDNSIENLSRISKSSKEYLNLIFNNNSEDIEYFLLKMGDYYKKAIELKKIDKDDKLRDVKIYDIKEQLNVEGYKVQKELLSLVDSSLR